MNDYQSDENYNKLKSQSRSITYFKKQQSEVAPLENFIPMTLLSNLERNENAYLNKAVALGIIRDFVSQSALKPIAFPLETKRLLYGQFGKIKTTQDLIFKTEKGNRKIQKNFQFEVDMVLENEDEIIIFEAKLGKNYQNNFSLLQLYYPYIYIESILTNSLQLKAGNSKIKPIRTLFIDIALDSKTKKEQYKLVEVSFRNGMFDCVDVMRVGEYV